MKKIIWNQSEIETINKYGEICEAMAREAMTRNNINFDDIEKINGHYESHNWGSDTDRKYRKSAVNKAVKKVAANPMNYV